MPQPIDFQTEVARVDAAERIQQIAERSQLAAHRRQDMQIEQQRVQRETQVRQSQAKSDEVERDAARQQQERRRRRSPEKKAAKGLYDEHEQVRDIVTDEGGNLDVTV